MCVWVCVCVTYRVNTVEEVRGVGICVCVSVCLSVCLSLTRVNTVEEVRGVGGLTGDEVLDLWGQPGAFKEDHGRVASFLWVGVGVWVWVCVSVCVSE